jgi:multiple sugar transport system ATP-binding protein
MILEVCGFRFRSGPATELGDISFQVAAGECVVIVTPVLMLGSSLLHGLIGMYDHARGEVLFEGRNLAHHLPETELLRLRRDIGLAYREGGLISMLNVQENIALPLGYHWRVSIPELTRAVRRVAEMLEIGHLLRRTPEALDETERRLVCLARELIRRPRLLLMDGILEGVAPVHRQLMLDAVQHHQREQGFGMVLTARENPPRGAAHRIYELSRTGLTLIEP